MTATLARAIGLSTPHRTGPWTSAQFAALVAGNLLAVVLAFVGWLRASSDGQAGDQIAWLNVSFSGVVVAIGVNGFFLARGRQTVRLATPVALAGVSRPGAVTTAVPSSNGPGPTPSVGSPRSGRFVAVAGRQRYHQRDCALVAGKAVEEALADFFAGAGKVPCEVCEP